MEENDLHSLNSDHIPGQGRWITRRTTTTGIDQAHLHQWGGSGESEPPHLVGVVIMWEMSV